MRILQLTPRMPYPLNDGGAIAVYNITKWLHLLGHQVTLLTYPLDTPEETKAAVDHLGRYADVRLVPKRMAPRWRVLLKTIFHGAYPIVRRRMPEMYELVRKTIAECEFDIAHIDHAHMGPYGLWIKEEFGLPIILRENNFESLIYERYARTEKNPFKAYVAHVHGKRLRKEEAVFLSNFDAVAAISDEDVRAMKAAAPTGNYRVLPAGVDTEYFHPNEAAVDPDNILSVGPLFWEPNFDATKYFLSEIFPLILARRPQTVLHIVGAEEQRIVADVKRFGSSIQLHGRVPDVRSYVSRASVLVVPLRIGGGMRIKLLEFFAAGKAVVSTSIGAEGNRATNGEHLLIRDTPQTFADAVLQLQSDSQYAKTLGTNARAFVEATYSWPRIVQQFVYLYETLLSKEDGKKEVVRH